MARQTVTLTDAYQQIASGAATFTIKRVGTGQVFFNETASDVDANVANPATGVQFTQNETKPTFARCSVSGEWAVLVDGVI